MRLSCAAQVDDDATADEIKRAYRSMAKECHPDYLGDKGHNICILLNEAYEVGSSAARAFPSTTLQQGVIAARDLP